MGTPDPITGMIRDFDELDAVVEDGIVRHFDHSILNEVPPFNSPDCPPTSENIARHILDVLSGALQLSRVRVYETVKTYAEVRI